MTGVSSAKLINPDIALSSSMDVLITKYNASVSLDRKLNVDNITVQAGEFQTLNHELSAKFISLSPYTNTATLNFGTSIEHQSMCFWQCQRHHSRYQL